MKKGTIWMDTGLLLLSAAFCLTTYNVWDETRAENAAEQVTQQLEEIISQASEGTFVEACQKYQEVEMPTKKIDGTFYIGLLEVPSLNLVLPVSGEWSESNARTAPCRYEGSAYANNLIIAGHNYRTQFAKLESLIGGDLVFFTDTEGTVFSYRVAEVEVLDGTAVKEMKNGDWDLTLFTCTYSGRARITIRCAMIL